MGDRTKRPRCVAEIDGQIVRVQPKDMVICTRDKDGRVIDRQPVPYPTALRRGHPFKSRADLASLLQARAWKKQGVGCRTRRSRAMSSTAAM